MKDVKTIRLTLESCTGNPVCAKEKCAYYGTSDCINRLMRDAAYAMRKQNEKIIELKTERRQLQNQLCEGKDAEVYIYDEKG